MILRELLLKLGLEVDEAAFAKGQLAAELIKTGLEKIVEVAKETVHEFIEHVEQVIEYGDQANKTAQKLGIATEAIQELQYAASMADVSAETMSTSLGILARNLKAAKDGSSEAAAAFKGIDYKKPNGELKSADEVLTEVAAKFKGMPDGVEKTALAMKLFGRGGKDMIPLLNEGKEGISELREEAQALGLVMSGEQAKASEELNDNLKRLKEITNGLWRGAIAPLIPAMNRLVERFLAWRKANAAVMAQRLHWFVDKLIKGIDFLGDVFKFLVENGTAVKIILGGIILSMIALNAAAVAAATASAIAWAAAAAPFVGIASAIAGILMIFDDIRRYHEGKGRTVFGLIAKEFNSWLEKKSDTWFVAAFKEFIRLIQDAMKWWDDLDKKIGTSESNFQKVWKYTPLGAAMKIGGIAGDRLANWQNERKEKAYAEKNPNAASSQTDVPLGAPMSAMVPIMRPEIRSPAVPVSSVEQSSQSRVYAPVQMNITTQPGQSNEDISRMVTEKITEHWDMQMEATQAQVSP